MGEGTDPLEGSVGAIHDFMMARIVADGNDIGPKARHLHHGRKGWNPLCLRISLTVLAIACLDGQSWTRMASSSSELNAIAAEAEKNPNSHLLETRDSRRTGADDAEVDSTFEQRFGGAGVKHGEDLATNAGYTQGE